ncbi:MAG: putative membrane-bound dehydrogenase-like protein [Pirellulaceae bacterium]|jgi:putative membrane-bound dehydrogenase-like protein
MRSLLFALLLSLLAGQTCADDFQLNGHRFTLPAGFIIEMVAGPPLSSRPICCDFDERGNLYVAESSGSNDPSKKQLEDKPHSILRLQDTDGDGVFERRTVYADKMMFPEGAMWYDGSLYVSAPPQIWKLTDTDDDGVCDQREVWFDGKTLTGCANDLHGPYRGPDGWIYWCKGAFAEQTHEQPGRDPLVTRAAHVFRRRPEGGPIESVMAGGMDNPVELIFTPGGEIIFTTTFLQHPGGGRRDGLIHAVYGGVYGKRHGVIDGHPLTGELLPPLTHLGAAAPCGLVRLQSDGLGLAYKDNVLACSFNMRKITRHILTPKGSGFETRDEDFLVSDNLDFHPTDVIEDADGSLIVIDTGGWYKLCCPTSQLWKPDVLGGIYRVRRKSPAGAKSQVLAVDPRGLRINWREASNRQLIELLADSRHVVRTRAVDLLTERELTSTELSQLYPGTALLQNTPLLQNNPSRNARLAAVWTLCRQGQAALPTLRDIVVSDGDDDVRQAALHALSIQRDKGALDVLKKVVRGKSPQNQRAAAEALGRLGTSGFASDLLAAHAQSDDRLLDHSLVYALIESGEAAKVSLRDALDPEAQRRLLIAKDQAADTAVSPRDVVPLLQSKNARLRQAALWVAMRHSDWGEHLVSYFESQLARPVLQSDLAEQIEPFVSAPVIQALIGSQLADDQTPVSTRRFLLQVVGNSSLKAVPARWQKPLAKIIDSQDAEDRSRALVAVGHFTLGEGPLLAAVELQVRNDALAAGQRLRALGIVASKKTPVPDELFSALLVALPATNSIDARSLAADILSRAKLSTKQLVDLGHACRSVGPLEIERVLAAFSQTDDAKVGREVILGLGESPPSLPSDKLRGFLKHFPGDVQSELSKLVARVESSRTRQTEQLQQLLLSLPAGDIRRGQRVFHTEKTSCKACHALGYVGGNIGPDLTRIGRIRSKADLLESIIFPSSSFVRSYEPTTVILKNGKVFNGVIREDNGAEIVLATAERKLLRISHEQIDERVESKISIMPAGLDKQLTKQEIADLIEFLMKANQ